MFCHTCPLFFKYYYFLIVCICVYEREHKFPQRPAYDVPLGLDLAASVSFLTKPAPQCVQLLSHLSPHFIFIYLFFFSETVLCTPGWPLTGCVVKDNL